MKTRIKLTIAPAIIILIALALYFSPAMTDPVIGKDENYVIAISDSLTMGYFAKLLIADYKEYDAECYADSTNSLNGWRETGVYSYSHREMTLPGFVEFMERKYDLK
ncbi:MAG TPA: hypothetical protein ENH87_01850 [Pricia antarctica]|uniref:Uncharacterized protein n=1 Tax=Pricia antarctica TaxID=641691 RepID=A0A831QJ80_9FLAO|nr:hypothetical protein [Pricia antarctica]